jgi:hypothetical protein
MNNNSNNNNNQNRNRDQGGHQRHKNNNQANNQKYKETKDENKKIPLKYETQKVNDPPTIELKYTLNNRTNKKSMIVYEDRTPEEILKLVREFQNIKTYNLWYIGAIIYADFHRCLKGNARDTWDIIFDNQPRMAVQFQKQIKKLIKKHIGQNTLQNHVLYLEMTRKPENMSVLQWIN